MRHDGTYQTNFESSILVKRTDPADTLGLYTITAVLYEAFIPSEQLYHIDLCQRIAG